MESRLINHKPLWQILSLNVVDINKWLLHYMFRTCDGYLCKPGLRIRGLVTVIILVTRFVQLDIYLSKIVMYMANSRTGCGAALQNLDFIVGNLFYGIIVDCSIQTFNTIATLHFVSTDRLIDWLTWTLPCQSLIKLLDGVVTLRMISQAQV